jgi:hypothetical protein
MSILNQFPNTTACSIRPGSSNTEQSQWNEQVDRAEAQRGLRHQRVDEQRIDGGDRYQTDVHKAQSPVSNRALATEKNLPRPDDECRDDGRQVDLDGQGRMQQGIEIHATPARASSCGRSGSNRLCKRRCQPECRGTP